ncbi:MAG: GTP cyclohydrolase I FolE2 [Flavobacteriales bacterium]|nr:GTP cyclohydrolase I FolE2 [Flavobacteriales bacterium]|tara:strand:- start:1027 stop:2046 length:1020 start_codon:yes stop_codon:yes gene_type:complete
MKRQNDSKYEWIGDAESTVEAPENKHSKKYYESNRDYDDNYKPSKDEIKTFPDLQNGPSSLIQGSKVAIQQVGIHNFRLPLKYAKREGGDIELETKVTGTVSLAAHKKGINMSRIMRSFYKYKDEKIYNKLDEILLRYKNDLETFDAKIGLHFSYPILQKSLRSNNSGYQYYNCTLESNIDNNGEIIKFLHFDFVYSSACPCSYELAEHAKKFRNKATVSHSQRSVARLSIEFDDIVWIEDLQEMCVNALKTETQVIVKREDEMAFAELNGSYLKFVEDAVRLLYEQLVKDKRIKDFRVICSHQESLHSHDAVSVILAPNSKFCNEIPHELWSSLIHNS